MAPELHLAGPGEVYGQSADVFSLGMVLIEMGTRVRAIVSAPREPRDNFALDEDAVREAITRGGAPSSFVELTFQCVAYEDYDRPPADDAAARLGVFVEFRQTL